MKHVQIIYLGAAFDAYTIAPDLIKTQYVIAFHLIFVQTVSVLLLWINGAVSPENVTICLHSIFGIECVGTEKNQIK